MIRSGYGSVPVSKLRANFFSFTSSGIWEDNLGNYGEMKCVVSLFSDSMQGIELIGYCEAKDNKDEKFWTKLDRTSSGQELGIGKKCTPG